MNFQEWQVEFRQHADSKQAIKMAAYMRNQFEFLGIGTQQRRELSKDLLASLKKTNCIDWEFIQDLWNLSEREFQYVACDYLKIMQNYLSVADIPRLHQLITTKSWWDTIDSLDRVVGSIALRDSTVKDILLEWSVSENIWLRRIAIDHQLLRKDKTDVALLENILTNNLGQTEFFINKAIGWALRDYSKTNPDWVRQFINKHQDNMSPLSIREGSKYV